MKKALLIILMIVFVIVCCFAMWKLSEMTADKIKNQQHRQQQLIKDN